MKVTGSGVDPLIFSDKANESEESKIKSKLSALKQELNELNKKKKEELSREDKKRMEKLEKQINKLEHKLQEIQAKKAFKNNKKDDDDEKDKIKNREDGKGENIDEYV